MKRKSPSNSNPPVKKLLIKADAPDLHGKIIKEGATRKRIYGEDNSQENEDSDRDEILQKVFGIGREQNESEKS